MVHRFLLFSVIRDILTLLSDNEKKSAITVLFLTLVGAVIDILGLALVLPVLAISSSPNEIHTNEILSQIYAYFNFSGTKQFLIAIYILLLVVFILRALVFFYIKYVIADFSFGLARIFSKKLFNVYLHKPLDFFLQNNSSDLLRDIYVSPQQFASYLIIPSIMTISEIFIVLFILGGLFLFNVKVFLLLIIVLGPVAFLFYSLTKSKMEEIGKKIYDLNGQIINKVTQGISGFVEVKLSGRENYFVDRFDKDQISYKRLNVTKSVLMDVFPKVIEFSAILGIVVIFIYTIFFLEEKSAALILLLSLFGASAYRVLPSISRIMSGMLLIKQYAYLINVLTITKETVKPTYSLASENDKLTFDQSITLKNILFYYEKETKFNIEIPELTISKGEKLGLIGKSGSGKTTLVNLILGFYRLNKGEMLIDGRPLTNETWGDWKRNFGYVQQDVFVSDVSLKENIAFGIDLKDIDDDRVIECVKMALLEDFVLSLEDGINSGLGENGKNMSGGQKQRLAIARSLYFNRQILIFDEATSALDNETEKEITDSIKSLSRGNITMIIIAHRYSTLKYCDRIIEMEKGQVSRTVDYHELLNRI